MSNIQKNSNDIKAVESEKIISEDSKIKKDYLSQKPLNENIIKKSNKLMDNEKIILNTPVNITVQLGKTKIKIKDFLSFSKGSMLILDKLEDEPLDIFINGHLIASGEIVVSEKKYGIRITRINNSLQNINISS